MNKSGEQTGVKVFISFAVVLIVLVVLLIVIAVVKANEQLAQLRNAGDNSNPGFFNRVSQGLNGDDSEEIIRDNLPDPSLLSNPDGDDDGDGIPNSQDIDLNGDGLLNSEEAVSGCGDTNGDGVLNQADIDAITSYSFGGEEIPAGVNVDLNADGVINIIDVTLMINHVNRGASSPTCQKPSEINLLAGVSEATFDNAFKSPLSMDFVSVPLDNKASSKEILLNVNSPISSLTLDLNADLEKEDSYTRVILLDKNGAEYLVYQASYPFEDSLNLKKVCEETCLLDPAIVPNKLVIETSNDSSLLNMGGIYYVLESSASSKGISSKYIKESKGNLEKLQKELKISKLNEKQNSWVAGDSEACRMSYADKKRIFNMWFGNTCGFECYESGVFTFCEKESVSEGEKAVSFDEIIFDYRNRHGVNWNTPIKGQGQCGACYAFGSLGALEGVINLYYNQHLDKDLSEQQVLSCTGGCSGGWAEDAYYFVKSKGVAPETMIPYLAKNSVCNDSATLNPYEWKISSYKEVYNSTNRDLAIRQYLVSKGPLAMAGPLTHWQHLIVLSGYGHDENGPYWIFKNSWGDWGENGYGKMRISLSYLLPSNTKFTYVEIPIFPSTESYTKICEDKDKDGFCNWGLGSKPASCSTQCAAEQDCDDSLTGVGNCFADKLYCGENPVLQGGEAAGFGSYKKPYELGCCGDNLDEFAVNEYCCNSVTDEVVNGICEPGFACGDLNKDSNIDQIDIDAITSYAFDNVAVPLGVNADMNGDGKLDIFDVTVLTNYVKRGGPAPSC